MTGCSINRSWKRHPRIWPLLIFLALLAFLAACGNNDETQSTAEVAETAQAPSQSQAPKYTIKTVIENGEEITMVVFVPPLKDLPLSEVEARLAKGDLQAMAEMSRRYLKGVGGVSHSGFGSSFFSGNNL